MEVDSAVQDSCTRVRSLITMRDLFRGGLLEQDLDSSTLKRNCTCRATERRYLWEAVIGCAVNTQPCPLYDFRPAICLGVEPHPAVVKAPLRNSEKSDGDKLIEGVENSMHSRASRLDNAMPVPRDTPLSQPVE